MQSAMKESSAGPYGAVARGGVLLICNLLCRRVGAFERFLAALGGALNRRGSSLHLLLAGDPCFEAAAAFRESAVSWDVVRNWDDGVRVRSWRILTPALCAVRRMAPAVVDFHFGNELPAATVMLVGRALARRTRWVWHQHQQIRPPGNRLVRHVSRIRALAALSDCLVALYDGGRRSLLMRSVPARKICVIPNGVRQTVPARQPEAVCSELGLAPGDPVALMVTSLIPRKRVDFAVRAFAKVLPTVPKASLLVAGEGPERARLQALVASLNLGQRVRFLGARGDVADLMAVAAVTALASDAEACPLALIESLAAGVPAVVTDAGACREIVAASRCGEVVGVDDVDSFAAALAGFLSDPALCRAHGARGLDAWRQRFDIDTCVAAHVELYAALWSGQARVTS